LLHGSLTGGYFILSRSRLEIQKTRAELMAQMKGLASPQQLLATEELSAIERSNTSSSKERMAKALDLQRLKLPREVAGTRVYSTNAEKCPWEFEVFLCVLRSFLLIEQKRK